MCRPTGGGGAGSWHALAPLRNSPAAPLPSAPPEGVLGVKGGSAPLGAWCPRGMLPVAAGKCRGSGCPPLTPASFSHPCHPSRRLREADGGQQPHHHPSLRLPLRLLDDRHHDAQRRQPGEWRGGARGAGWAGVGTTPGSALGRAAPVLPGRAVSPQEEQRRGKPRRSRAPARGTADAGCVRLSQQPIVWRGGGVGWGGDPPF